MSLKKAREVLNIESRSIAAVSRRLNMEFLRAITLIVQCKGRVVVTGMGKTGIIGRKIAATLSSTGTPSIYMHSADAVHGDLGQIKKDDILILISYSGETEETIRILPLVKKIGSKTIAITGNKKSSLAKHCNVVIDTKVEKEGCPLGLAPMASTTVTLAIGDALAACLIERKKFKKEDFAFFHPGGALGRRLLLKVSDIMRTGNHLAKVKDKATVKQVLFAITKARCGSACVVDGKGVFVGIFTDGDLRRHIELDVNLLKRQVKEVMTKAPRTISKNKLAAEAFHILEDKKIDEIPVVDEKNKLVGLLDVQDLLRVGLL